MIEKETIKPHIISENREWITFRFYDNIEKCDYDYEIRRETYEKYTVESIVQAVIVAETLSKPLLSKIFVDDIPEEWKDKILIKRNNKQIKR